MFQRGFIPVLVLVILVAFLSVAFGGYYLYQTKFSSSAPIFLPVPGSGDEKPKVSSSTPTPTPKASLWKDYLIQKYNLQISYPPKGVVASQEEFTEGECGKAIEEKGGQISFDNLFTLKIIDFDSSIEDYLTSQGAGDLYETEEVTGSGADRALELKGLKKGKEYAVGYPPLIFVSLIYQKGSNLFIFSPFKNHDHKNEGGCIHPDTLDPVKWAKYRDQGWSLKENIKFLTGNLTSGISGKILLGPSCPAVRPEMEDQCQDKPYQTTVVVKNFDGSKEVTRFTSDEQGRFKVSLTPGNYQLGSAENVQLPLLKPVSVEVKEGQLTNITLSFDTGIR